MKQPSEIHIRPILEKDQQAWHILWKAYLAFYKSEVDPAVYETTFSRLLTANDHDFHGLVAEHEGKLVGITHYLFHRHCWRIENVCYLQDLFVTPKLRGTGAGRKLIEAVYAAADAAGAPQVYWLTQDDNKAGRQLYDRVGKLTNFIKYQRSA